MILNEKILKLCDGVLSVSPDFWDNPNGGYENTCPFCREIVIRGGDNSYANMSDIEHSSDCTYLLAKDLFENLQLNRGVKIEKIFGDEISSSQDNI